MKLKLYICLLLTVVTANTYSQVTLTVVNTNNSGPGSLSDAVNQANLNSTAVNPYTIEFDAALAGSTIFLDGSLIVTGRSITVNGDVDGDFRPDITIRPFGSAAISGFEVFGSGNTISYLHFVEFDDNTEAAIANTGGGSNLYIGNYIGTDPTGSTDGLAPNFYGIAIFGGVSIQIGDGTPEGANIIGNNNWGIYVQGVTGTSIRGNHIGVDVSGTAAIPNSDVGIELLNTTNTTIGGPIPGTGNIISGNGGSGIELTTSQNTIIAGNYIGTDISGNIPVPNQNAGILAGSNSMGSFISQNVISGNGQWGIDLSNSSFDQITGNYIGTDASGTNDLGNNNFGIWIRANSTNITIGDGTVAGRNIISGNSSNGLLISGGTNTVIGNYIGLDATGSIPIGNANGGIVIAGGVDNVIGGEGDKKNVVSGNSYGLGVTVPDQFIYGNYIGTDATGLVAIPNLNQGIRLTVNARNVAIGDGTALNANVISGNTLDGIYLDGSLVNSININFNYIGTGPGGSGSVGNGSNGILIEGDANTNNVLNSVIAHNGANGIEVNGIFASGTAFNLFNDNSYFNNTDKAISVVFGAQNSITPPVIVDNQTDGTVNGTSDPDAFIEVYLDSEDEGELLLGNTFADAGGNWSFVVDPAQVSGSLYYVTAVQTDNGNTSEFSNAQFLNLLFAVTNTNDSGPNSLRWVIDNANNIPGKDNIIFEIPNTDPGYSNNLGEEYWTIRPSTELPQTTESIIMDATNQPGSGVFKIRLDGQNTIVTGINVGFGNSEFYGLHISGFTGAGLNLFYLAGGASTIGAPGKGNLLSGNDAGLSIVLADNNIIQSNIIGLDETGKLAFPNRIGLHFPSNSGGNIIGGNDPTERNIISGNIQSGITINAGGNYDIINNYIGTDDTGLIAVPNGDGIRIGTSANNEIYDNIIAGNSGRAMFLSLFNNALIQGNYIGVGADGLTSLGNDIGIMIWGSTNSDNNLIGGILPGEANIIANNNTQGVLLASSNADFNQIIGNSIYCNGGLGIDLNLSGPAIGNDGKLAPEITSVTASTVTGTGVDGEVIHVYRDITACIPVQGGEYLGTTVVSGGTWSLGGLSLSGAEIINATATDSNGNTSQFAVDYPEVDVYLGADNTGIPVIDDQLSSVNLGSETIGTDLDVVFTVDNPSWVPLSINSINVADTEFSIVGAPLSVGPKSFENFTIRLDGSNYGVFSSAVNIDNTDPDESSFDFPIDGEIIMDFVVRNTDDSGVGSLRFCIDAANAIAGYNEITFDIPISDVNYNASTGRWTISPASDLPALSETVFLDADTQPGSSDYRIIIDGSATPSLTRGIEIAADDCEIDGFYILGFEGGPLSSGILISAGDRALIGTLDGAEGNLISQNTRGINVLSGQQHAITTNIIGLDTDGITASPNFYGIWIEGAGTGIQVGDVGYGNVISGSLESAIWLQGISNSTLVENIIGMDVTGLVPVPNFTGVVLQNSSSITIDNNTISGNSSEGISLRSSSDNTIVNNRIGVATDGTTPAGNEYGIVGGDGGNSDNNVIGLRSPLSPNIIAHNTQAGISLDDPNYDFNTIEGNQIYCNGIAGIDLQGVGNDNVQPPDVISFNGSDLVGTGIIGHLVNVYTDDSGCSPLQGKTLIATTTISDTGWSVSGISLGPGEYLNLTATDPNGNTSEFAFDYAEITVFEGPDNSGAEIFDAQATVVDLGSSFMGTDILFDITVENSTGAPLTISDLQADIPEISFINVPAVVEPFSSSTFTIQLDGSVVAVYNSTVTITNNDPDESIFTFNVTGTIATPQPEITVFEGPDNTGTEILSGQAGAVNLGSYFYSTPSSVDITIENTGVADLSISGINASDIVFSVTNIPTTITPGNSATFQVQNDGLSSGVLSADITIQSDDPDESTFTFPVTVTVSSAGIIKVIEGQDIFGNEIISGQAMPYDLGGIDFPQDLTGTFTIQNLGDIDLNISSINSSNPSFSIQNIPGLIPSGTGGAAMVDIILSSSTPGNYSTNITITSDDPTQGTFTFPVIGTLRTPILQVFNGPDSSAPVINPDDNIDFGTTGIDQDLLAGLTLQNAGDADLQISDITIDNPAFTSSVTVTTLAPGTEEALTITLDASIAGIFSGRVTITTNDPENMTFEFNITAEVLAPVVTVRENNPSGGIIDENTPVDVGTTPPSTLLTKIFTIENTGNQVLNIVSIVIDNPLFSVENIPGSIDPQQFGDFTVVFSADILGPQQGTVTITTDAGTFTFFVTANVVDVVIYNVLSPNGDGIHDFLKIENIEFFSSNTVYIYTRWGDTIFKTDGYDNNNNVFSGVGNQGSVDEVAEGTYYYVVVYEYENSNGETVQNTLTGFFLIKR